ncbi:non-lysosomal glucosylceramidase [Diabrotica virgifera virgifera]|uniref:NLGase n=1 Tax=Diabrotica virgifera virgifera TaxID=50390 RepID=A0ABM5JKF4_DIAVI|nr:non-lysosomal glucosylceramidase [Diabrotica virgifera virgifera]XP_050498422.1 non-lysosomal glucosylceramidase [Diabrotica virgifera virgifera]
MSKVNHTLPPKYGLKLSLDYVYPEKRTQNYTPSLRVIWNMLPLILRYLLYYIKSKWKGHKVVMDYISPRKPEQIYGVPIGGIGCGTIGRGYKGQFCRFQLKPGIYEWNTVDADDFLVVIKDENGFTLFESWISTYQKRSLSSCISKIPEYKIKYTGLYPRSWTEYDLTELNGISVGIKLTCRQISPVIPHNYKDSALPCAVFVWTVENVCSSDRTVTIAFTFKNGTGSKDDKKSACSSKLFSYENTEGVILYHMINKMPCAYALAAKTNKDVSISKCLYFDPKSNGFDDLWFPLHENGEFDKPKKSTYATGNVYNEMGCGIAAKIRVPANQIKEIDMSLVWDMPTISFPNHEKTYDKFYTEQFGKENAILKIVDHALNNYTIWEDSIYNWQKDVLEDSKLPDWYKGALFNETYFVSDGGSLWLCLNDEEKKRLASNDNDPRNTYGHFAYLEGQEYIMYNSYDVHFYASHALHKNWPMLQKCLQYDLRDFISLEINEPFKVLYNGKLVERKYPNTVPHDAGSPGEEPLTLINAYPIHDVSHWRDLNSKFILQTFRDAYGSSPDKPDLQYLEDMYSTCYTIIQKCIKNEINENGLIENGGIPDQTYDSWTMSGVSAYCGGLWLCALKGMSVMATQLGKEKDAKLFQSILSKAQPAFEKKLWNGKYYNFDCSESQSKSVMADQLCGHWYLGCSGLKAYDVYPKDNVKTALKTIYKNNVQLFCDGNMGAVNGTIDGKVDGSSVQSVEVWTGVTYALAATMILEGMVEEGFKTAGGMYNSMTKKFGMAFDTPEALYGEKYVRAVAYMRPLSIWSMQTAWEILSNNR